MSKSGFFQRILSVFFPARCPYCRRVLDQPAVMCDRCRATLGKCPYPIPIFQGEGGQELVCLSPFLYQRAVKNAVTRFKFKDHPELSDALGSAMAEKVRPYGTAFDCVTCVPLARSRFQERGYNQSELLARRVGKDLSIPYRDLLEKWKETPAQHTLGKNMREQNVAGVYRVKEKASIVGKQILLCDDIVTTGATLRECSRVLLEGGAASVTCCTLASAKKSLPNRL